MPEKLKSFLTDDTFYMAVLLILVSLASFGLGRESVVDKEIAADSSGVIFKESSNNFKNLLSDTSSSESKIVVSKAGTKYHLLNCPGASQIKNENKIYFGSIEQAEAAGYKPAANCADLN